RWTSPTPPADAPPLRQFRPTYRSHLPDRSARRSGQPCRLAARHRPAHPPRQDLPSVSQTTPVATPPKPHSSYQYLLDGEAGQIAPRRVAIGHRLDMEDPPRFGEALTGF